MGPCQWYRESIFDFVDSELDTLRRKELKLHLDECPECAHLINRVRLLKLQLKKLPDVKASEGFHLLLRENIRRELAGRRKTVFTSSYLTRRWIPAMGFTLVTLIVSFWIVDQNTSLFHSRGSEAEISRSSGPSGEEIEGQVQYVMDDFPNRVSVSRTDNENGQRIAKDDSLLQGRNADEVRSRLTKVSF
ncbi:MAG: zf-HC2 domain-containing protein [bacterium]